MSDLVGPSWCEYNYQYGILSLSHLPPSLRPAMITTESGYTLSAAPQLVAQKESTLRAGKAVHAVLERQVASVQVVVETETKHDSWALRLLNLWCNLMALVQMNAPNERMHNAKQNACAREIPVYGWVHGVLVMGVIDEIEKRTTTSSTAQADKHKTWRSQEEWRKDPSRKSSSTSSQKSKQSCATSTRPLTAFFSTRPSQSSSPAASIEAQPSTSHMGWGYFLSDTKTRFSSWLPSEEDQFGARMQCMTYKRLFDGLLLGALLASSNNTTRDKKIFSFDVHATPMNWRDTFASLDLDPDQPLSAGFLRDAESVCESWGVDLQAWVEQNDADVCTLNHVILLLEDGLRGLAMDAQRGAAGDEQGGSSVEVIQDTLALTYRRQMQRGRRAKRKKPIGGRRLTRTSTSEVAKMAKEVSQTTLDEQGVGVNGGLQVNEIVENEMDDDDQLVDDVHPPETQEDTQAATESKCDLNSLDGLGGHKDAQHAIQQTLTSHRKRASSSTPPPPLKSSAAATSPIIGIVSFTHDAQTLDAYLECILLLWNGQRQPVGVAPHQTRRCWTCEWIQGCEWRAKQAQRSVLTGRSQSGIGEARVGVQLELSQDATEVRDVQHAKKEQEDEFWSTLDYDSIQVRDANGNLVAW